MLIKILNKTINVDIQNGIFVLFLAKKKLDRILIKANAGIPQPKYFKADAVILIFSRVKDPYPNNALTISLEAKIKPKLAGIENKSESSIDLL